PAPVCSPTRISLQTGISPAALRWTKAGPSVRSSANAPMLVPTSDRAIDAQLVTIGELLQDAGYTTAHLGKWHLQGGGPARHGYDVSDGNLGNEASGRFAAPNPVDLFGMAERAEAFMAKAKRDGKPFYLQLSWLALHSPDNALPETVAKYRERGLRRERQAQRAALTENMDTAVGRVLDAIDRLGLAENTYVVFMSDNGGHGRDGLRDGKGSLFEGGVRVPMIVRGPGIAPGSWCHQRVVGYDLYPTFADWAGAELPQATAARIEGGSWVDQLSGQDKPVQRRRDAMVFHFPHYQTSAGPHSTIYLGPHKLIRFYETGELALFNLENDLREQHDLAASSPRLVRELEQELDLYLAAVEADLPRVNPDYDPDKPSQIDSVRGERGERERSSRGERQRDR
ncbi:MAG: sulfatase-like hydrolase/transferase, partial [Planctomycetota bacterium]